MNMKYRFTEEQCAEIKAAVNQTKDKQIYKRLRVLELRCDGVGLVEIAKMTGFHRSHVSNLVKMYYEQGLSAVGEKHYPGNHRNMSYEQEEALLDRFRQKAEEGHILDVREIEKAYEQEVGHSISSGQIYRVLHRHGWRKVMPRSRHPKKASDEAIEASKKLIQQ